MHTEGKTPGRVRGNEKKKGVRDLQKRKTTGK